MSAPTPYYDDGTVTIYRGDCRVLMPMLTADVLIADPPYGMAYVSNSAKSGPSAPIIGDGDTRLRDWLLSYWGDRPAILFGTWRVPRPPCRALLVWDKGESPGMGDLSLPWGPSHEEIYVTGAGWRGRRIGSVLRFPGLAPGDRHRPDHPTPKPLPLMRHLIERAPTGTIVDPCAGSGSTLRAAKDLGRRAIGIEIEERYCEIAAQRCAQDVLFGADLAA